MELRSSHLQMTNKHVETLNIGCNKLGAEGVQHLKKCLQDTRCNLHRLGLQSTSLDCQGYFLALRETITFF